MCAIGQESHDILHTLLIIIEVHPVELAARGDILSSTIEALGHYSVAALGLNLAPWRYLHHLLLRHDALLTSLFLIFTISILLLLKRCFLDHDRHHAGWT